MLWEILQNSQENICIQIYFLIKLEVMLIHNFIKNEALMQVFACELRKICKNIIFEGCY